MAAAEYNQCLLTIVEAAGLEGVDKNGLSDPYVVVRPEGGGRRHHKLLQTKVVEACLDPVWRKSKVVLLEGCHEALRFEVMDYNKVQKAKPLGHAVLPLDKTVRRPPMDLWLPLEGLSQHGRLHVMVTLSVREHEKVGSSLLQKIEKFTRLDLDGDGAVGLPTHLEEVAKLKAQNAQLRQLLMRSGQDPAQLLTQEESSRTLALAYNAEVAKFRRRKTQAEIVDTPREQVARMIHTSNALNFGELACKGFFWDRIGSALGSADVRVDWNAYPRCSFGAEMREKHFFVPEFFLNAASYGAAPKAVVEAAHKWREIINFDPATFLFKSLSVRLQDVTSRVAGFVGTDLNDLVLMENANAAISTVFKSMAWMSGDRLFIFDIEYEATKLATEWLSKTYGVDVIEVELKLPLSDEAVLQETERRLLFLKEHPPMPRLATFCHVTSKTGWILPVKKLTRMFHRHGIPVMVDGAQVPGHIPLCINDIAPEYYVGTLHKWMYTIQGTAFLVVQPHAQSGITTLTTSYYLGQGYEREFSYQGLRDFSGLLAVGEAMDFVEKVCGGWKEVWKYTNDLARQAVDILQREWGTTVFQPDQEHYGRLPIVPLPRGDSISDVTAKELMCYLNTIDHITCFLPFVNIDGKKTLCVRLCAQIWMTTEEITAFARAVLKIRDRYSSLGMAYAIASQFIPLP